MSSHSQRPSIYLLSPSKLATHCSPDLDIASRIKPVISGDVYIDIYVQYEYQGVEITLSIHILQT